MEMIADIIFARDYVASRATWIVMVVPDDQHEHARKMLAGVAEGETYSGRTVLLPSGGKVSLTKVTSDIFVPDDQPFSVMFLGWGKKALAPQEMAKWRQAAQQVLRSSA